jgi:hypothetical protein
MQRMIKIDIYFNFVYFKIKSKLTFIGAAMSRMRWIDRLAGEDLAFLKRFLLASGSLKKIADEYGISYPTVRLRLDRLIQKVEIFDSQAEMSEFERQLRATYSEGKIDQNTFERLLASHRQDLKLLSEDSGNEPVVA